jgi:hypothetical protein
MLRVTLGVLLLSLVAFGTAAQTDNGRFCVRVFEDRNRNLVQDAGEPPVTQNVGANLRPRGEDVILASTLMQNAADARAGQICFENLALGLYEIELASAAYAIPAGDDTVFTPLTETQPVIILSYGVPPQAVAEPVLVEESVDREAVLERSLISGAGALIAMSLTAFLGLLIYVIFLRGRSRRPPPPPMNYPSAADTGPMRAASDDFDYNSPPTRQ